MDCQICMSEYAPNSGVICFDCGYRFCGECYLGMQRINGVTKCPNCRSVRPFGHVGVPALPPRRVRNLSEDSDFMLIGGGD